MAQPDNRPGQGSREIPQEFKDARRRDGARLVERLGRPHDHVLAAMIDAAQTVFKPLEKAYQINRAAKMRNAADDQLGVEVKEDLSLVTRFDNGSQATIISILEELGTNHGEDVDFFGEEGKVNPTRDHIAAHRFVIDPLDGTGAYTRGENNPGYFAVSIADIDPDGNIIRSVILDGRTGEMLVGTDDGVSVVPYAEEGADIAITKLSLEKWGQREEKKAVAVHLNDRRINVLKQVYADLATKEYTVENYGSLILDLKRFLQGDYRFVINGGCFFWDIAAAKHMIGKLGLRLEPWNMDGGEMPQYNNDATSEDNRKAGCIVAYHPGDEAFVGKIIDDAKGAAQR